MVSLSQRAHTSLSGSALFSERVKGAALSVKTQICCFSNFTYKYSRNHSTAIVFILCVTYLILSEDSTIINQFFVQINILEGRAVYVVLMGRISVTISYSSRCLTTELHALLTMVSLIIKIYYIKHPYMPMLIRLKTWPGFTNGSYLKPGLGLS